MDMKNLKNFKELNEDMEQHGLDDYIDPVRNNLREEQIDRIIRDFFDSLMKHLPWKLYHDAGGTWKFSSINRSMTPILRRLLEEVDQNTNTVNLAIRFMNAYDNRMSDITRESGGSYATGSFKKENRSRLTALIDRELGR